MEDNNLTKSVAECNRIEMFETGSDFLPDFGKCVDIENAVITIHNFIMSHILTHKAVS